MRRLICVVVLAAAALYTITKREPRMPSKRCSECSADWPPYILVDGTGDKKVEYKFDVCPECGGKTWRNRNGEPPGRLDVLKRVRRARFEDYYRAHDEARWIRGDPSPEELGVREAREIIALESLLP